ncbi:hypothetical protein AF332_11565 [Sporosarcina globispora]|uniref:Uncharacterized protein n=1 Tax=Sporosarcina globispora TaxID=1459 RepID=A0A0M0GBV5_SPOGL|nr:hypothetical protein [Sporosarcina globispora]KON87400.1 hypothetical protein AF332_11565 [Sporosarcina globispora]
MSSTVVSLRIYKLEKQYKDHYRTTYASCANFGSVKDAGVFKAKVKRTPEEIKKELTLGYMKLLSNNQIGSVGCEG